MQDCQTEVQNTNEALPARGPGRPATITLEVIQQIGKLIAKGMTEEQACVRVGVNHASFRTARHRNPEFETAVKESQVEFLDAALDNIGQGGKGWQGRAWILERRHGDQFRRNTGVELAGNLTTYDPVESLIRKPLARWTKEDVDRSLGAWKLIRRWPKEQVKQLSKLYDSAWGPMDDWSDEQLEWHIEVCRCLAAKEADGDDVIFSNRELLRLPEGSPTTPPPPPKLISPD